MSSVEKREIIQNGIFSIPLGFIMGGPAGAIGVAVATATLAHIEEIRDRELLNRKKEENEKYRKSKEEAIKKFKQQQLEKKQKEEERRNNIQAWGYMVLERNKRISNLLYKGMYHFESLPNNYTNGCYIYNHGDIMYNTAKDGEVCYAKLIFANNMMLRFDQSLAEYEADAVIYNSDDFLKKLIEDCENPNFESYIGCNIISCNRTYPMVAHKIKSMYTIDGGKSFVCMM